MARLAEVHKVISYDENTREVLIYNWGKYNWSRSGDFLKGANKIASLIKSQNFQSYITACLNGDTVSRPSIDPLQTVNRPSIDPVGTTVAVSVSVSDTVSVTDTVTDTEYKDDFEIFWDIYPKKVGKKEAYKAFQKAHQPVQLLVQAVKDQMQSEQWLKENGRYIPNPTTWLNQWRWEDVLPKRKVGERNSEGFYTLSNGMQTSNPFLAMLDKEANNDEGRDNADIVHIESGLPNSIQGHGSN